MRRHQYRATVIAWLVPLAFSGVALAQGEATTDATPPAEGDAGEPGQETEAQPPDAPTGDGEAIADDDESPADATSEANDAERSPVQAPSEGAQEPVSAEGDEPDAEVISDDSAPIAEEISDAELEEYLAEEQLGDVGFNPTLEISGFADFNYTHFISKNDDPWRILYNNKGNFGVGNLNLYLDGKLSQTVRSFAEVRFTYLPHGNVNELGPPTTRADNASSDYTRNERDIRLGALRIERVWLQWSPHQLFRIKAGHWLTPYGVWNVDHGTPTIVSVTRPFIIDEQLLPESQAGLLAEGRFDLTDQVALEYGAGISNGRGPIDMYYDYDANKGFTGRLELLYTGFGELQVGASVYRGRYTDAAINLDISSDGLSSEDLISVQFDEVSYAADIRYANGGLLFQSEAMLNDRKYTDEGRPATDGGLTADNRRWGVYALTGYRFDIFGIMPYVIGEYAPVPNATIPQLPREVLALGGGLNIRPAGQVVVKVGYDQAILPENRPNTFDQYAIRRLQGQVAWAF